MNKRIVIDSEIYCSKEDLEAKGYKVASLNMDEDNWSYFDPYKALKELDEKDPVKFAKAVKELKAILKKYQ